MDTESPLKRIVKSILCDPLALVCVGILFLFLGVSLTCEIGSYFEWFTSYQSGILENRFQSPSIAHWCGTDYLGRDVFERLLQGSRTALKVGVIATIISIFIGTAMGLIAGYFGGAIDDFMNWIYSTFAAMPTMLFILAFALLVGKGFLFPGAAQLMHYLNENWGVDTGMVAVYLGIGLTGWVSLFKVTRSEVLKIREMQYVQAAKLTGISTLRILLRHILPNIMHLVIIYATLRFGYAIMTEVIVSYLGLGVSLEPSWGVMIAEGQQKLWQGFWWEVTAATVAIILVVLPLNLLGDKFRDILDPRLQS